MNRILLFAAAVLCGAALSGVATLTYALDDKSKVQVPDPSVADPQDPHLDERLFPKDVRAALDADGEAYLAIHHRDIGFRLNEATSNAAIQRLLTTVKTLSDGGCWLEDAKRGTAFVAVLRGTKSSFRKLQSTLKSLSLTTSLRSDLAPEDLAKTPQ